MTTKDGIDDLDVFNKLCTAGKKNVTKLTLDFVHLYSL